MASLQGRMREDLSGISVWSEIAQGFWLTPTTKTPETLGTEEVPFISHQGKCAARLCRYLSSGRDSFAPI